MRTASLKSTRCLYRSQWSSCRRGVTCWHWQWLSLSPITCSQRCYIVPDDFDVCYYCCCCYYYYYCYCCQMVLKATARLVVGLGKSEHITPVLCNILHWLPVPQRIQIKIAVLTFDCVRGTRPAYFSSIACTVADNSGCPGLRSAERDDLFVPRTRTTRLGRQSFFITAPVVWNSLPLRLRSPTISRSQFRTGLKTGWPFTDFSSENCWRDWTELNWTVVVIIIMKEKVIVIAGTGELYKHTECCRCYSK